MEYHVLSNITLGMIFIYGGFSLAVFWAVFGYFAQRDALSPQTKTSFVRKLIPWLILMILLSDISLFIYRCVDYPWNIEPQPSQASVYREMTYMGSRYPLWGWANDYQLPLLSSFTACLMWFGWTIYAFNFKASGTSWWKKACKVIAYLILSVFIYGFNLHELRDLWTYAGAILVVAILLWIAKVRPSKEQSTNTNEEIVDIEEIAPSPIVCESKSSEDPSRFMPKSSVVLQPQPTGNIETPSINEPEVLESVSQEDIIPQLIQEEVVEIKGEVTDPPQQPVVCEPKNSEDPSRFMSKSSVVLKPQPTDNTETHSINEPVVSESVSESVSQESNIPQQIQEKVVEIKEEIADPPQQPVDNVVDIEMMYCKHCGKRIEADSTFCKYCGKRVK